MASVFTSTFDQPVSARAATVKAEPWQAVPVEVGDASISMSREEAAQLAADLLAAVAAKSADDRVPA